MRLLEKVPKKITPDRIRESIVQIFASNIIPFVPSIGFYYSYLSELGYTYESGESLNKDGSKTGSTNFEQVISFNHLFISADLKVKIQISPTSVIFNCVDEYIGWDEFSKRIYHVYNKLYDQGFITSVNRIGMRYISSFPSTDFFTNIELTFDSPPFDDKENIKRICVEKIHDDLKVVLNLIQTTNEDSNSTIDLDVISDNNHISVFDTFKEKLEYIHEVEKKFFFSTLKQDFIKTLDPQY